MHKFLANNRDELIARCKAKVAMRPLRAATIEQLKNGIPLFLEQLIKTLKAEADGQDIESLRISGAAGGDALALSEMGVSATAHGKRLLELGYSVDQVVHDYGDLCQSITGLAVERDAPFSIDEFRTLNRCLDNVIADAVTEFTFQREAGLASRQAAEVHERHASFIHEVRNSLGTATLAAAALELGSLPMSGATGSVLKRSLAAMKVLIDGSLKEVQATNTDVQRNVFPLAVLIANAGHAAALDADAKGCKLTVPAVDPLLAIKGNQELLLAALMNLLHNALKFTHARSEVTLHAHATGDRVLIDVEDHCGGLPPGAAEKMFSPFAQLTKDATGMGLGLGLSIARRNVEADGGTLSVRDVPGTGCIFTINLARHTLQP